MHYLLREIPGGEALLEAMRPIPPAQRFDSAKCTDGTASMDACNEAAASYAVADIRLKAVAAVHEWAETQASELASEGLALRFQALMIGIADANKDGEISDAEEVVIDTAYDCAWDYLVSKGVSDDDCDLFLSELDDDAATRVQDLIIAALPDGDDAVQDDINGFAFGDEANQALFDAAYKMRTVFQGGKKMRMKKRIAGYVRLSAAQKLAIRKMNMRSHSPEAQAKRMKSLTARKRATR
ncbi:MAG: hypothetical protein RL748_2055 [Pseudomonadota bacterium]|jgi:hypothetical protein